MEEGNKQNQVVTSVGNAWIICRSKSHPGRIYYFNTVSGEAAWNLSETEIEKAKNRTKNLENPELLARCPEPKEPPMDGQSQVPLNSNHNFTTPRIYNKQIINNKFPNQPCTFTPNPEIQYVASLNPIAWKMSHAPTFNSVWDVPPSHQIFITPTVTQEISQATALNITNLQPRNMSVQTSLSMTKRFGANNYRNSTTPTRGMKKYHNKNNYRSRNQRLHNFNKRKFQNNVNINDLRQKLCAKRSNMNCTRISDNNVNEDPETYEKDDEEVVENTTIAKQTEKVSSNEQSPPKLNLKPLRDLAVPEAKLDCWYIVPDTSVLLCNLMFLELVIESDEDCCLMVPQYVMTKLQALAFSSEPSKFRARNAIHLLTQQFDAGSAFITSEESSQTESDECANVFNSCLYLVKGNNHVVLLSNNIDMLRYKYTTQIPIFTVTELKYFLRNESCQQSNPISNQDHQLKIIVSNEKRNVEVQVDNEIACIDSSIIKINEESTDLPESNKDRTQTDDLAATSKCKMDAGVQTDNTPETVNTSLEDDAQCDVDDIVSDTVKEIKDLNFNKYRFENEERGDSTCKKRQIRLKRSISNQKPQETTKDTADKKQYNWRGYSKKKTSTAVKDKSNLFTADKVCLESQISAQDPQIIHSSTSSCNKNASMPNATINDDLSLIKDVGSISCSNIEDSESSNSIKGHVFDRITIIEETSTSGIISNTGSNVDSEIVTTIDQQKWQSKEHEMKNVMFEVTSHNMEEFLKMRCDEWVSRFVQIMEDVLTEILHQGPQFTHNKWPPPWTLREATHCIALKFKSYPDVVDAAYQLSSTLKEVSDNRGAISFNLKPSEYMKMYSFGVYMVDTLQDVHNCEELQIAAESLKKLLNDIQNANQDFCQNESFVDYLPKNTSISTEPEHHSAGIIEQHNKHTVEQQDVQQTPEKLLNSSNYNLRSNKRKIQEQKNINIEYSFFNSLKLKKTCNDNVDSTEQQVVKCVASKHLLNSRQNIYLEEDQLDYDEDFEYGDEEYLSDDEYYYGKEHEEFVEDDLEEVLNVNELNQSEEHQSNNTNSDQKFKHFVGVILKEIRETFGQVQTLCEGYYQDINGPQKLDTMKRKDMKEKAEKAQILIENLCECLDSILQREENNPGHSIQNILKMAHVDDFYLDDNMCAKYKNIITKCKDQAGTVLSSIRLIINSIEV